VWEEDGEELLILTSVQEMTVQVNGGRRHTLVLAFVEWPVIVNVITHVLLLISLLMEGATREYVGELKDIRRETLWLFMGFPLVEQLIKIMFLDYQSLTVAILINIFGVLLVAVVKNGLMIILVLVLELQHLLLHMLALTITVNQLLGIVVIMKHIFLMTLYGMEQDA